MSGQRHCASVRCVYGSIKHGKSQEKNGYFVEKEILRFPDLEGKISRISTQMTHQKRCSRHRKPLQSFPPNESGIARPEKGGNGLAS